MPCVSTNNHMKAYYTIIIAMALFSCQSPKKEDAKTLKPKQPNQLQQKPLVNTSIDTSSIAIIKNDEVLPHLLQDAAGSAELSNNDLKVIDKTLETVIADYNSEHEIIFKQFGEQHPDANFKREYFIIDLKSYKRQYIAFYNKLGEKEVWVNCICNASKDWQHKLVTVKDGGNCYFNLKINLTRDFNYDFYVNGSA